MRVFVLLLAVCLGCSYETNYYGAGDGGVNQMPGYTDEWGDYHETEPNLGVFRGDSKLQGNAQLTLAPAPALVPLVIGGPVMRLPFVREDLATMARGETLIDLMTRDGQPHVVTLSFGKIVTTPVLAAGPFTEVVAVLSIGIGGTAYYAEIDVIEGLQFSLSATRLQVHVVYRIPYGGGALPATPPTVNVGASISSDVIAHGRQPQRTIMHAGSMANPAIGAGPLANGVPFILPAFAKSFRVLALPNNSQFDVDLFTVTGANPIINYPVVAPALQDYPIPTTTYYIITQNQAAATVWLYAYVFELAL